MCFLMVCAFDLFQSDVKSLTKATEGLRVDSPAMNTRRQSSIRMSIGTAESVRKAATASATSSSMSLKSFRGATLEEDGVVASTPLNTNTNLKKSNSTVSKEGVWTKRERGTKRQSTGGPVGRSDSIRSTNTTDAENTIVGNTNEESAVEAKRSRKDLSYSRPGPPTPARRHNRSGNNSLNMSANKSMASNASVLTTGSNVIFFYDFPISIRIDQFSFFSTGIRDPCQARQDSPFGLDEQVEPVNAVNQDTPEPKKGGEERIQTGQEQVQLEERKHRWRDAHEKTKVIIFATKKDLIVSFKSCILYSFLISYNCLFHIILYKSFH